jgi:hypothetical protein
MPDPASTQRRSRASQVSAGCRLGPASARQSFPPAGARRSKEGQWPAKSTAGGRASVVGSPRSPLPGRVLELSDGCASTRPAPSCARSPTSRRRRRPVSSRGATGARICAPPSRRSRPARSMDGQLGRGPDGPVTLDFDATGVEVYGRQKRGAGVTYRASWPIGRCCARGRNAAGCSRPSCWPATTPPAAWSPGSCCVARLSLSRGQARCPRTA